MTQSNGPARSLTSKSKEYIKKEALKCDGLYPLHKMVLLEMIKIFIEGNIKNNQF